MLTAISVHMKRRFWGYMIENRLVVIFFLLFILGAIFGAVTISQNSDLPSAFCWYLDLCNTSFLKILSYSMMISIVPLLVLYCSGLFMYGCVPCILLFLFQGMGYGTVSGYLYNTYGLRGVAFVLLVFLPGSFLNVVLQLIGSREAFRFSVMLCKNYYQDMITANPLNCMKRFHLKYLLLLGFALLVALLSSVFSFVFIDVFAF